MTTSIAFHDSIYAQGYGVIKGDSIVSETITESGSSQQSAAATKPFVTVVSTVAIWVAIGSNPTATTASSRQLQTAGVPFTYGVSAGHKVAVVTA